MAYLLHKIQLKTDNKVKKKIWCERAAMKKKAYSERNHIGRTIFFKQILIYRNFFETLKLSYKSLVKINKSSVFQKT